MKIISNSKNVNPIEEKKPGIEKIQMFGISLLRNIIPVTNDKEKKYSNTMLLFFANSPLGPLVKFYKKPYDSLLPDICRG